MKKNILGLLLFCCMGLFVSCSDDDSADAKQLRISAMLPESIATGQTEVAGHKLRCILELWTKGEGAKLAYHSEIAVEPATEKTQLPFDMTIDNGTYDCLMWVDYIDASATPSTRAGDGTSRYADKYYNTSNLKNITVNDMNSLINNDACDAFYFSGEVQKMDGKALVLEPELVRPFAKVSVLEKNLREFNLLKGLTANYKAPAAFDISTGTVTGEAIDISLSIPVFDSAATPDGTLFSTYIFAGEEGGAMGEIHLNFTTKQGVQQVTVPADLVPVLRNQHIKVSGNMMNESPIEDTEFDITFDINVSDWETGKDLTITTRPLAAKVGDFIYKDGTFGKEYNEEAIGIIFALKENFTDNSDYGDAFAGKKIAGYAMALESTTRNYIGASKGGAFTDGTEITTLATTEVYNADYTVRSYNGYEYSEAFNAIFGNTEESLLFNEYKALQKKYEHSATNLTDWYIPSAHQAYDICARIVGVVDKSMINETLKGTYDNMVERIGTQAMLANHTGDSWLMTSSFDKSQKNPVSTLAIAAGVTSSKLASGNWQVSSRYVIRPVLTVFEGE